MDYKRLPVNEKLMKVREVFIELIEILNTEGGWNVRHAKRELNNDIKRIERALDNTTSGNVDLDEVLIAIRKSYEKINAPGGGFREFYIQRNNTNERVFINKPLSKDRVEIQLLLRENNEAEELATLYNQDSWNDYLPYCTREYHAMDESLQHSLDSYDIPEDIRVALLCRLRGQAEDWFTGEIPAFDYRKPVDLIKDPQLINAVREGLMRMPD